MQTRLDTFAKGLDLSHWQGVPDFNKLKTDGISFIIAKATEGLWIIDDMLQSNVSGAKSVGILVGTYHFCHARSVQEAIQEANFYCDAIQSYKLELPPVLDMETSDAPHELVVSICHMFLETVEKRTGVKPMIYASRSYIDENFDTSLSAYPLWLACYGEDTPTDRGGWTTWEFMQTSETGKVDGIQGACVDINYYKGTVEEMFGYKMPVEIANPLIDICSTHWKIATTQVEKDAWHVRANSLRSASGQPTT